MASFALVLSLVGLILGHEGLFTPGRIRSTRVRDQIILSKIAQVSAVREVALLLCFPRNFCCHLNSVDTLFCIVLRTLLDTTRTQNGNQLSRGPELGTRICSTFEWKIYEVSGSGLRFQVSGVADAYTVCRWVVTAAATCMDRMDRQP